MHTHTVTCHPLCPPRGPSMLSSKAKGKEKMRSFLSGSLSGSPPHCHSCRTGRWWLSLPQDIPTGGLRWPSSDSSSPGMKSVSQAGACLPSQRAQPFSVSTEMTGSGTLVPCRKEVLTHRDRLCFCLLPTPPHPVPQNRCHQHSPNKREPRGLPSSLLRLLVSALGEVMPRMPLME